jgi:hypothetical protein
LLAAGNFRVIASSSLSARDGLADRQIWLPAL